MNIYHGGCRQARVSNQTQDTSREDSFERGSQYCDIRCRFSKVRGSRLPESSQPSLPKTVFLLNWTRSLSQLEMLVCYGFSAKTFADSLGELEQIQKKLI